MKNKHTTSLDIFKKLLHPSSTKYQEYKEKVKPRYNYSTNYAIYNTPITTTNISLHYPAYRNFVGI